MKFASGFFEGTLMRRFLICVLLVTISWSPTFSTDWPRFRGPNGSGVSDTTGLPVEFEDSLSITEIGKPLLLGISLHDFLQMVRTLRFTET